MTKPLIEIDRLTKIFTVGTKHCTAVRDFTLTIFSGETVALVGESGCGKSTVGKALLRLITPTHGKINFDGSDIASLSKKQLHQLRRRMQMIFQDPTSSLNPRMTVAKIVQEPLDIHKLYDKKERLKRVEELLELVGLENSHLARMPHHLSGGQRQRIGIARALALLPEFIVCDEPISSLDVSIQAQIVNLLKELQKKMGLTYLFISHDLSVVKYMADRVAVMYLGQLMELADVEQLYSNPAHPYSQALLSSIPIANPILEKQRKHTPLPGEPPNPFELNPGCPFASRCPMARQKCRELTPILRAIKKGQFAACHYI